MSKRPRMHDSSAPIRRAPDRGGIEEIIAVDSVIADDLMAEALQMSRYRGTHMTVMPGDQNLHNPMIGQAGETGPTSPDCGEDGGNGATPA
jgi:hypothetical protein